MKNIDRKPFEKRFAALKQERTNWEKEWKEIADYIIPLRGMFDEQANTARGVDTKKVIDSCASDYVTVLGAGLTSGLTSPSRPWFRLGLPDRDMMNYSPVKMWLMSVQELMMSVFAKSNIYSMFNSMFEELGGFCTGAGIILPDHKTVIRGRDFTCGEYYLGTGPDGRVDTFARSIWKSVGQLVEEFGIDNVSSNVRGAYEKHQVDQQRKVIHLIEPNDTRIPDRIDFENMPWRSVYWEDGANENKCLRYSGFKDFPVVAPRWRTISNDVYGKGPGWLARGDVKMLQRMRKDGLLGLDKMVNPPVLKGSGIRHENLFPGGVTNVSLSGSETFGIKPAYEVKPDMKSLGAYIQDTKDSIGKKFFYDLFLMFASSDRRDVTAEEIVKKYEEKLLMLGPVLVNLQNELLEPTINRTFGIMLDNGIVPPPPPELDGIELTVEYISTLAQAQKMAIASSIERTAGMVGNMASVNPDVLDKFDFDQAVDRLADVYGTPPDLVRSDDVVEMIRKKRQEAQAQAQQAQTAMAMVAGAKTLSDTPMGQGSALDAIAGGNQQ